jgi:FixJ family two-component response regulator
MPGDVPKIVVVEDDASMSQAIERILRVKGFAAVVFGSAEAALDAGAATTADCLVLDIHLPGMSGIDLYRRLAADGEKVRAVFITAHDEPAVREDAERRESYLTKPFSGRALLDAITHALGSN